MKYIYELIGAFFLVLTVGMTVVNAGSGALFAPVAIGSMLAVLVYAGGHVSGGHYNPAVSLFAWILGKLTLRDLGLYWTSQLLGALAAAFAVIYLKGGPHAEAMKPEPLKMFLAEFLFTFALCFVVWNVAMNEKVKNNSYYGFAIGFTILAGAFAVGAISGGAFNPAVALGITVMNLSSWKFFWIFLAGNGAGAIISACFFKLAGKS